MPYLDHIVMLRLGLGCWRGYDRPPPLRRAAAPRRGLRRRLKALARALNRRR